MNLSSKSIYSQREKNWPDWSGHRQDEGRASKRRESERDERRGRKRARLTERATESETKKEQE